MPRDPVLRLLASYQPRATDPHESAMVQLTLEFVHAHADCLCRTCVPGHLTGSAWIVSPDRRLTLLTHHRKLDKWLQLGGHADGQPDLLAVAVQEAYEESGLTRIRPVSPELFDVDRHWIPPHKADPAHAHYDLRFLFEADPAEPLRVSSESTDLAWVELTRVAELNPEPSMVRMVQKTARR